MICPLCQKEMSFEEESSKNEFSYWVCYMCDNNFQQYTAIKFIHEALALSKKYKKEFDVGQIIDFILFGNEYFLSKDFEKMLKMKEFW